MANIGGILATVLGSGAEGGFHAWGTDIKEKRRTAAQTLRDENIARLHSMYQKEGIQLQNQLTGEREGKERKWKSGESEKERKSREKIAGMKADKESTADKKYKEKQALQAVAVELEASGIPVQQTESGLVMAQIPVDKNGKPKDPSALIAIDRAGLKFKTGKPVKTEGHWFGPDDYMMPVYIGGMKPKGLIGGVTPASSGKGLSMVDKLFSEADKKLGGTNKTEPPKSANVDTSDIAASEIFSPKNENFNEAEKSSKGILSSETKESVPYYEGSPEGPTKEQVAAAKKELADLGNKLIPKNVAQVGDIGDPEYVGRLAKEAGGWAWTKFKQIAKILMESQAEARKGLPAYK